MSFGKKNIKSIVFLSGLGIDVTVFNPLIESLNFNGSVTLIQYPSLTNINKFVNPLLSLQYVTDQIIQHIPEQSIVCGWSLGGLFAINLCQCYPDQIIGLITLASTPRFRANQFWPGIAQDKLDNFIKLAETDMVNLMKKFISWITFPYHVHDIKRCSLNALCRDENFIDYLMMLTELDLSYHLLTLAIPSLHVFGARDAIVPIATERQLNMLNNTTVLEDAGHGLIITHTEFLTNIIHTFVEQI